MRASSLKREWWPRSSEMPVDSSGFLGEAREGAVTLAAMRHIPFLALVGESGLGKTCALDEEALALRRLPGVKVYRWSPLGGSTPGEIDAAVQPDGPGPGEATIVHLLLDGLDNGDRPLERTHEWLKQVFHLVADEVTRLRVRMACRPLTWRAAAQSFGDLARAHVGDSGIEVFDLCPLSEAQVTEWAQDGGELLASVHAHRLGPLASRPLGLKMLEAVRQDIGAASVSASSIYELYLTQSLGGTMDNAAQRPASGCAPRELARRTAAGCVFGSAWTIDAADSPTRNCSAPHLGAPASRRDGNSRDGAATVRLRDVVAGDSPSASELEAWNALICSSLVRPSTQGVGHTWVHSSFAEVLAAEALAFSGGNAPTDQAMALLFSLEGGRRVPVPLAGVAAWAAAICPAVLDHALAHHPAVLLQLTWDRGQAARIIQSLIQLAGDDRFRDLDHLEARDLRGLDASGAMDDLRTALASPDGPMSARRFACTVLALPGTTVTPDVAKVLIDVVLDTAQPVGLRTKAAWVVADKQLDTTYRLRSLAEGGTADADRVELRSAALVACWPDAFEPDPFGALGSLARRGVEHVPHVVRTVGKNPELLVPSLQWVSAQIGLGEWGASWGAERLVRLAGEQADLSPEAVEALQQLIGRLPPGPRRRLAERGASGNSWPRVLELLGGLPLPPVEAERDTVGEGSEFADAVAGMTWTGGALWSAALNHLRAVGGSFASLWTPALPGITQARLCDAALAYLNSTPAPTEPNWPGRQPYATAIEVYAVWALALLAAADREPVDFDAHLQRWATALTGVHIGYDDERVALARLLGRALEVAPQRVVATVQRQLAPGGAAEPALEALAQLPAGTWHAELTDCVARWLDALHEPGFAWMGVRLLRAHAPDRLVQQARVWASQGSDEWAAVGYAGWTSVEPGEAATHLVATSTFRPGLLRRLVDRLEDVRPVVRAMGTNRAAWLLGRILESGETTAAWTARAGDSRPLDSLERLEARLLDFLVDEGADDALDRLGKRHPLQREVLALLAGQARRRQAERVPPLAPKAVTRILLGDAWPVRSAHELQSAIMRALPKVQEAIRQNPGPLWNEARNGNRKVWTLKDENAISDQVAHLLRRELGGSIAGPFRETALRHSERPDFVLAVGGIARVLIEAKGAWDSEVVNRLVDQLAKRYLKNEGLTHGVYLAYWASPADWSERRESDRVRRVGRWPTPDCLRDALRDKRRELPANPSVEVFVLDCSRNAASRS